MARKQHLINVHTSTNTTAPTGASLYLGEIAVQHTENEPALWIKMGSAQTSTDYEKFIGETEIINLIEDSKILGSGYTYSGLSYVNSATTIADAYSALTKEMLDDELVVSEAFNSINDRLNNMKFILGSGYTYSGLPYVNSATTIADAYSALTNEVILNEKVGAGAINALNIRVNELSANTAELEETVSETEEIIAGAINVLSDRIGTVETRMTGDYIPITGYMLASGTTEEELALSEEDTVDEAFGKLQKQMLDNEEAIAAGFNYFRDRFDEIDDVIAHNTGITQLSGAVASLSAGTVALEQRTSDEFSNLYSSVLPNYTQTGDTQALSATVMSISAKTSGILTLNLNGVEQGKYSPSANTTINLEAIQEITGADVLLTGYELASGSTEEELVVVATDTVNEAFGKLQKQNYDNEAVVAGALNDIDERVAVLSGVVEDNEYITAQALISLNDRIGAIEGDSGLTALSASVVTNKDNVTALSASVVDNKNEISALTIDLNSLSGEVLSVEYVVAQSLNNLNDRVGAVEDGVDDINDAITVMPNKDVYVYGIGGYDGTNPSSASTLQEVIGDISTILSQI